MAVSGIWGVKLEASGDVRIAKVIILEIERQFIILPFLAV
jgi:hypothetical protein